MVSADTNMKDSFHPIDNNPCYDFVENIAKANRSELSQRCGVFKLRYENKVCLINQLKLPIAIQTIKTEIDHIASHASHDISVFLVK